MRFETKNLGRKARIRISCLNEDNEHLCLFRLRGHPVQEEGLDTRAEGDKECCEQKG